MYFVSCVVIVYHFKINEQAHYVHHEAEVASVCVSRGGLVASGERGKRPAVHVWSIQERRPLHVFRGHHKADVYLMAFVNNDRYLVTCGKRLDTPVIIYSLDDNSVVLSTHVDQFVRCILNVNNLVGSFKKGDASSREVESHFVLLSAEKIYVYLANQGGNYESREQLVSNSKGGVAEITAGSCFFLNYSNPDLKAYVSKDP